MSCNVEEVCISDKSNCSSCSRNYLDFFRSKKVCTVDEGAMPDCVLDEGGDVNDCSICLSKGITDKNDCEYWKVPD